MVLLVSYNLVKCIFLSLFTTASKLVQPRAGEVTTLKDIVVCNFPHDHTVVLGSLSFIFLTLTTIFGFIAVFSPYNGKSIPAAGLFRCTSLLVFVVISVLVSVLAGVLLLWATISEGHHILHNVHHDVNYQCPTAKTGLLGSGGFLALDSALFWLVCQMLTLNSRTDYEEEEDLKGDYGQLPKS
ncbi:hypothetical protein EJ110_NYTH30541 [Nymphaea thermarum]|nr:hypothetical protein EJ110_NYTH30541 [Nymphaea thermarum]